MPSGKVSAAIAAYMFCSASLLVINKLAVSSVPATSFVLLLQFGASVAVVKALGVAGVLEVEPLQWDKAVAFSPVALLFSLCLFTNVRALHASSVETVIVARSLSPIFVAFAEWHFMGKDLPDTRGWLSLGAIALGATIYVLADAGFAVEGYFWVSVYLVSIIAEMTVVKFVISDRLPSMSSWTRVYYNNVLSVPPVAIMGLMAGEVDIVRNHEFLSEEVVTLLLSMVVGVGISYAGFNLRALVSATYFTLVGVLCKLGSVAISAVVTDSQTSPLGLGALIVCIGAGTMFQQTKGK